MMKSSDKKLLFIMAFVVSLTIAACWFLADGIVELLENILSIYGAN